MAQDVTKLLGMSKEDLEFLLGRGIQSVDPNANYSKNRFVSAAGTFFDVRNSLTDLTRDMGNYAALQNLASVLSPSNPGLLTNRNPQSVVQAVGTELNGVGTKLAKYTERNNLSEKLQGAQANELILILGNPDMPMLYNDSEDDKKLMPIIHRQNRIVSGRVEELSKDFPDLVSKMPEWHRALFNLGQNDPQYKADFLSSYANIITSKYQNAFFTRQGDHMVPDKAKLIGFYDRSMFAAQQGMIGKSPEEQDALWDAKMRPVNLIVSEILYSSLKK